MALTRDQITSTVREILTGEFEIPPDRITDDANLFDDLELDSLDAVDLIVAIEQALGGRVPEEEAKKVRVVADIYTLVETHLSGS